LSTSDFEYSTITIGIYKALLWLTILIALGNTSFLIIYISFLLFLGLGLKPILIKTGLAGKYQAYTAKRMDRENERLRRSNYKINAANIDKRDKHLEEMRKKLMPKG